MRISFWQLRHPWRHGKLSLPLASVLFHSICPLSLNLLISTSLPYFVREAISEIYMKRQFPSSPPPLAPPLSHTPLRSDGSKEWHLCGNDICSASFPMLFFGWEWLVSLFTRFGVTNGQSWCKLRQRWCSTLIWLKAASIGWQSAQRLQLHFDVLELISSWHFSGQIFITGFIRTFGAMW